jgi:hypothetical protein
MELGNLFVLKMTCMQYLGNDSISMTSSTWYSWSEMSSLDAQRTAENWISGPRSLGTVIAHNPSSAEITVVCPGRLGPSRKILLMTNMNDFKVLSTVDELQRLSISNPIILVV